MDKKLQEHEAHFKPTADDGDKIELTDRIKGLEDFLFRDKDKTR
jgi:hypothetical protein